MAKLSEIAFGKANDVVKLAFLNPEKDQDVLNDLDLTMLAEVKKSPNGAVELKLVNRLDVMKMLLGEFQPSKGEESGTAKFFQAINDAAKSGKDSE